MNISSVTDVKSGENQYTSIFTYLVSLQVLAELYDEGFNTFRLLIPPNLIQTNLHTHTR